jgi:hypothetical protein
VLSRWTDSKRLFERDLAYERRSVSNGLKKTNMMIAAEGIDNDERFSDRGLREKNVTCGAGWRLSPGVDSNV